LQQGKLQFVQLQIQINFNFDRGNCTVLTSLAATRTNQDGSWAFE
jgi:hypothetical protein